MKFYIKDLLIRTKIGDKEMKKQALATGGIVRNHNGEWIISYNRLLGSCSVFDAELWDILDGLGILIDGGYDHVRIQADSLEVAKVIQKSHRGDLT
ncbi:hypothetical protein Gotri_016132 [Gossypium trilobum]|uniref:RNase H type-1 domain-containing protein n=1 Tax=Gossypium trilobum TaxID=34281 RepID=A0A7J9E2I2_9ROSI|nr:hypothetical protein [Gossypium trilobum]